MNAPSFEKLESADPKEKYSFVKELLLTAREHPESVYPYFPQVVQMLDTGNTIIVWAGIELIGCLSRVDEDHRIVALLPKLYAYLNTGKMITANHAVSSLLEIARVERALQDKIIEEVLKTQEYEYDTEECKNIVYGTIIKGMMVCYPTLRSETIKYRVLEFIRKQRENTRNATRKKAEAFLDRFSHH